MRVMVNAGSLIARMGCNLLSSNLRGTFLLLAVGKNGVFDCFQGSWARPREFFQGEGNEGSHLLEQSA